MVTKQDIRRLLSARGTEFTYAKNKTRDYFLQPHILPLVINNIVEQANKEGIAPGKNKKPTQQKLFQYFYKTARSTVEGTMYGNSAYRTVQFIKTVWAEEKIQRAVMGHLKRNGFVKVRLPEDKKVQQKELTKEEKAQQRAYKMRVGRAKKRAEKLNAKDDGKKWRVEGDKVVEVTLSPKPQPTTTKPSQPTKHVQQPQRVKEDMTTDGDDLQAKKIDPNKIPSKYRDMRPKYRTKTPAKVANPNYREKKQRSREEQERINLLRGMHN